MKGHFAHREVLLSGVADNTSSVWNGPALRGQRDENLKQSPKSNYYWPLEQRGYWRSGCKVSHCLLWSPGLVYRSPGWPPVAWQPALSDGPASCWRGRFPPATAVGRWTSGGDTRTGMHRRSLERRSQTFCPVWMPGRSLRKQNDEIRDMQKYWKATKIAKLLQKQSSSWSKKGLKSVWHRE